MQATKLPGRRTLAVVVAAVAVLFASAAGLFIWSGIYNVAASKGHFAFMRWLLQTAMEQSVKSHSRASAIPRLADPDLVRLGAGHFASGCAPCHGAPGEPQDAALGKMLPPPPPLSEAAMKWSPAELHWIVKNGIKYTGMPAWTALEREDEVWALVAFLQQLPDLNAARYRQLASGNASGGRAGESPADTDARPGDPIAICSRCHDTVDKAPASRLVPSLQGQHAGYLERALREYAAGTRPSGIMQPLAKALDNEQVRAAVAYYSALSRSRSREPPSHDPEAVARGREIATTGSPTHGIPPCLVCHSERGSEKFPLLFGQSKEYLAGQLQLWQRDERARTGYGAIMSVIARRLSADEVRDVAAFFESASPAETLTPAGETD